MPEVYFGVNILRLESPGTCIKSSISIGSTNPSPKGFSHAINEEFSNFGLFQ
jgi:hypothetical protein